MKIKIRMVTTTRNKSARIIRKYPYETDGLISRIQKIGFPCGICDFDTSSYTKNSVWVSRIDPLGLVEFLTAVKYCIQQSKFMLNNFE